MHCPLEALVSERTAFGRQFPRPEKQETDELRCAVTLNFASLTIRGLMEELVCILELLERVGGLRKQREHVHPGISHLSPSHLVATF